LGKRGRMFEERSIERDLSNCNFICLKILNDELYMNINILYIIYWMLIWIYTNILRVIYEERNKGNYINKLRIMHNLNAQE